MLISQIVAMASNRVIGNKGGIPWKIPGEQKMFKNITMGHAMIMGRKTYQSIGKPLPGRNTVIITRNPGFQADGCAVVHSLDEAIKLAKDNREIEAWICGGGSIYQQAIQIADRIYLTRVHTRVRADVFFPKFDESLWKQKSASFIEADSKNEYPSTFSILEKIRPLNKK